MPRIAVLCLLNVMAAVFGLAQSSRSTVAQEVALKAELHEPVTIAVAIPGGTAAWNIDTQISARLRSLLEAPITDQGTHAAISSLVSAGGWETIVSMTDRMTGDLRSRNTDHGAWAFVVNQARASESPITVSVQNVIVVTGDVSQFEIDNARGRALVNDEVVNTLAAMSPAALGQVLQRRGRVTDKSVLDIVDTLQTQAGQAYEATAGRSGVMSAEEVRALVADTLRLGMNEMMAAGLGPRQVTLYADGAASWRGGCRSNGGGGIYNPAMEASKVDVLVQPDGALTFTVYPGPSADFANNILNHPRTTIGIVYRPRPDGPIFYAGIDFWQSVLRGFILKNGVMFDGEPASTWSAGGVTVRVPGLPGPGEGATVGYRLEQIVAGYPKMCQVIGLSQDLQTPIVPLR